MMLWRRICKISDNLKKVFITNKITRPTKMGDKILFLATAPCVEAFFMNDKVKEQFAGYDIACINYMIYYSKEELFNIKPKYIVLFDPIFYDDNFFPKLDRNPEKEKINAILRQINWKCYIVTSVLANFDLENNNIDYIRLSCISKRYRQCMLPLFKKNLVNMGIFNVIQGSIFFAVTFGYKSIAILGCTYKNLNMYMEQDGLHIWEQMHYYDKTQIKKNISIEELCKRDTSFIADIYRRAAKSLDCCWNLKKYADSEKVSIINYSEGSAIDAFQTGKLHEL